VARKDERGWRIRNCFAIRGLYVLTPYTVTCSRVCSEVHMLSDFGLKFSMREYRIYCSVTLRVHMTNQAV